MSSVDSLIGSQLKSLRSARNLSAETFCQRLNIALNDLAGYESGDLRIPASTLFRVSHELRAPIEAFFMPLLASDGDTGEDARAILPLISRLRERNIWTLEMAHHRRFLREDEAVAILRLTASIAKERRLSASDHDQDVA